ncbi:MAG TPA: 3-dehydroquinate synthase [Acidothermaceae bacterium]
MTTRITVAGEQPYDVVVGFDVLDELRTLVQPTATRVAVIHQPSVSPLVRDVVERLGDLDVVQIEIPDAEAAKSVATAELAWECLGSKGFTRSDIVIGVGGGAATDLAGFVAATWLRGVDVVQIPTTLLGMVDAAVGGKTGINTASGKNLVGAFHPPSGVLCELSTLTSVSPADYAAGLAEVVKAGFIADPEILRLIEEDPRRASSPSGPHTQELITRAIAMKAAVVGADLRERAAVGPGGLGREILNYGHTLGHAIEKREHYGWRHGDAVSVGLVFAAALSRHAGLLDAATAERHRVVLESLGLPTRYAADAWPQLRAAMSVDKKARGARLRFVVLEGLARARILADPDEALLEAAYAEVAR